MKKISYRFLMMFCAAASVVPHTARAASQSLDAGIALPELRTLHIFNGEYGASPEGELTLGPDGAFYGATDYGGSLGYGTLFKIDPDGGAFTTLFAFNDKNGSTPSIQKLTFDADGAFYGTTMYGGKHEQGTLFKMTKERVLTTLHEFKGSLPLAAPIIGPDGNLYGTTLTTIYRVVNGVFQTLYTFPRTDGVAAIVAAPLVVGPDNALYGCTVAGGGSYFGVIFRITLDGDYQVIHAFHGSDGSFPSGGLTVGPDGSLYGTTDGDAYYGGMVYYNAGTVFKVTLTGKFNSLHSFTNDGHGLNPRRGLTLGADGNFYGSTNHGGTGDNGTIFEMTPEGKVTTLYKFHPAPDGTFPHGNFPGGGVTFGPDGALYGSTTYGGWDYDGTLYRLALP